MTCIQIVYFQYITTLKARNCDILDIARSIQYLPLNKLQFLRVHNFIQMIESTFVSIKHCIFLFNEQLVWWVGIFPVSNTFATDFWTIDFYFRLFFYIFSTRSEINPSDLYSIYEYLTGLLFPKCTTDDLCSGSLARNYANGLDSQYGAYLAGPTTQSDNCKKPSTVHISTSGHYQTYKMIVYNALSGTLCLFVNGE